MVPVHKGGNGLDRSNCRPVSPLQMVPKAMQRCISGVISRHLVRNGLLSQNQHGFVSGEYCLLSSLRLAWRGHGLSRSPRTFPLPIADVFISETKSSAVHFLSAVYLSFVCSSLLVSNYETGFAVFPSYWFPHFVLAFNTSAVDFLLLLKRS